MKLDRKARYAETHEWARKEGDLIVCGISDHAQEKLSDVVYVELPEVGEHARPGATTSAWSNRSRPPRTCTCR